MTPLIIALLVLASIAGTGLMVLAIRASAARLKAQETMAARNGWHFAHHPGTGGAGSRTVISDPDESWSLTLYASAGQSTSGGSANHWTRFEDSQLTIPQGLAVLGPEIPEKTAQMADKLMGMMGGDLGVWLLDRITGGLGEEASGLRSIDGPGPGHLMAAPGAETALDDLRYAPELHNARLGKNEMQQPLVMRGPFGLQIRQTGVLRKPKDIEAFIELGRALADNLRP